MSDGRGSDGHGAPIPPPPPVFPPTPPSKGKALGWFFAVSGSIVLVLTLGCMLAAGSDKMVRNDVGILGMVLLCGSPTLLLGSLFLWLGVRRLKR